MKKTQKVTVKAAPSAAPGGAKTIALATKKAGAAPPGGAKTIPLATKGAAVAPAGTQALPKATVMLQKGAPAAGAGPGATAGQPSGALAATTDSILLEDEDAESGMLPFTIAAAVLGLVALIVSMMASDVVGLGVPEVQNVSWEKNTGTGWTSSFGATLPDVPVYK